MYTHCPECNTYFRITAEQLRAAQGKVRCSNCDNVFNALETLEEELPAGQVTANADQPASKAAKPKAPKKPKGPKRPGRALFLVKALLGVVVVFALMAAMAGQVAYFKRDELAQKVPVLRPYLEQMCTLLQTQAQVPCTIALPKDYSKLVLEHKDIRLHPRYKNALLINASLVNQAGFVQPYPVVKLTFTNAQGEVIASRGFQPTDYLPATTDIKTGLAPQAAALLVLEVVDPGPEAINFTFDFL